MYVRFHWVQMKHATNVGNWFNLSLNFCKPETYAINAQIFRFSEYNITNFF